MKQVSNVFSLKNVFSRNISYNIVIPTLGRVLWLLILLGLLTLTGAQETGAQERVRIGFVSHQISPTDLFGQLEIGFRQALDEAGLEYEYTQAAPSASHRHDEMLLILLELSQQNLDYLVFGPSSLEQNTPGLARIAEGGTKILMIDYEPPETPLPFNDVIVNWTVYDHGEMGFLTGQWLAQTMLERGITNPNVAIVWGPVASEISQQRGFGVLDGFASVPEVEVNIVHDGYANFQRDLAYEEGQFIARAHPDVDVIVGMNSNTALGIRDALLDEGRLDSVLVAGMGGQSDELEAVARGQLGVAVFRDPRDMGARVARALLRDHEQQDQIDTLSYTTLRVLDSIESIRQYVPTDMLDIDAVLNGN
jgi:ABC-type sugar transport system substrate-binding protein